MKAEKAELIVAEIKEYLGYSIAHLSQRTDYAKGYKEGISMVRGIISDIIEKYEKKEETQSKKE